MTRSRPRASRVAAFAAITLAACPGACPKAAQSGPPPPQPSNQTPPPAGNSLTVTFPNASASDRPLLLYSGERDGACRAFEAFVGTSSPTVTLQNVQYDPSCPVEFDVLTPDWGTYGSAVPTIDATAVATWNDTRANGTMVIPLPALTPVPVTIWIVASNSNRPDAHAVFAKDLDAAAPLLEELGAGVTLGNPIPVDLTVNGVAPDCAQADAISKTAGKYNTATLNVYYVENYRNQQFSNYGMDCWAEGHPEILFVSWGNPYLVDPILAHEVGHALGLFHPVSVGGHTNTVVGFDDDNLMHTGAPAVTNISIGQSYALNFSGASFFNRAGSSVTRSVVRACQDSWLSGQCPDLTLFLPGWPQ